MFVSVRPLLLCNWVGRLRKSATAPHQRARGMHPDSVRLRRWRPVVGHRILINRQENEQAAVGCDDGGTEAATCFGGGKEPK